MEIRIIDHGGVPIAEVSAGTGEIADVRSALDLLADANNQGASRLLVQEQHLAPSFYDLRSGLAGEILQKFVNYQTRLAVTGDFDKYTSKSLHAFILECNRGRDVTFCADRDVALARLTR
ncbi:MAG: DUF4180 domain-containing protein [Caldilineaceae bacterium]